MKREMVSICAGTRADSYRANTATRKTLGWLNNANRKCAGPCGKARSLAQFAANDDFCAQCRRRAA